MVLRDHAARERIVTDLRRNLLVEAGAGSGKTHAMAARMAAGVASGDYDIGHMAAVTFTRKAAAELRGRFHLALEAELRAATESARRSRIERAVSNLERFFAGTIHSFCARLLRERPIEAGVSPGFIELDEVDDKLLRLQSWRDYRSQARAAGDPDLALLADADIHAKDLDKAFETICLYEDVEFPANDVPAPDGAAAWTALDQFWRAISQHLPAPVAEGTTCVLQKAAVKFARDWRFATGYRRTPARLAELLSHWNCASEITQKWWSDDKATKKTLNALVPGLHKTFLTDVVKPWLTQWRQYLYAPCIRVLTHARSYASADRRRRNSLSFNDLLLLTAQVLRENDSVRVALQQKYCHLFVDEFQDTDPVQAEIMLLLASPTDGVASVAGSLVASGGLRPGALFVVGDPKQSIYRFRRADISIFNEVRSLLNGADGEGVVPLTTNFRSVPDVCEWANQVFAQTFPAEPDQWQPQFQPLQPMRDAAGGPALCTLTTPASVEGRDVAAHEAECIARYIRAEVEAGRRGYEDFLILTRRKKALRPYAAALEALQVPIEVSGAGGFGESDEVRALANLLLTLADPQDSVALVGVLRGRFFGVSDPQLFAYRQAGGYFGIFSELPTSNELPLFAASADPAAQPVAQALASLRRWYKWTRMLPAGAALDHILEDSGHLALAATSPGGVEAGDLLHAIDRVRAAVEVGLTLAEAAEALIDDDLESSDVESLALEPGRRDVVRLMNLHKAKGLEAAVVFLADPIGGFTPRVDVHVVRPAGAVGATSALGYLGIEKPYGEHGTRPVAEPPAWDRYKAAEQRFLDAELNRLLYVAATRAKDTLVVGRYAKGGGTSGTRSWEMFDAHLAGVPELVIPAAVPTSAPGVVDLSVTAAHAASVTADAAHERVRQPSWIATSVTAEIKHLPRFISGGADASSDAADDPTRVITAETSSRRADAGLAWGTLVHGLLEHAMRYRDTTRDDLRRLAVWLTVEEPDLRSVIEQALDTVQSVAAKPFWNDARVSAEVHEEVPFGTREQAGQLPKVINGAIDLIYRTGASWRLVDYKTDRDSAGDLLSARYAEQLRAYQQAWENVTGDAVTSAVVSTRGVVTPED
ncbi:MAG: UvrD-helicase domain-containing protein [Acidobacteriota bacterium]